MTTPGRSRRGGAVPRRGVLAPAGPPIQDAVVSDNSGEPDRGRFAGLNTVSNAVSQILIAIAAIGSAFNVYLSFREEQAAKPKVILVQSLPHLAPIGRSGDNYEVKMTVLNAGDKVAHGCLAFVQDVDDEFLPHRYFPRILETEPFWSVSPGKAHSSKRRVYLQGG